MRVGVIGATGVVGRNLVPRLVESGYQVKAGGKTVDFPVQDGVERVAIDLLDPASIAAFVGDCDAVINVASAIPRPDGKGATDWKAYDRLRHEGVPNLLKACGEAGVGLVQQSIAMLHAADTSRPQAEGDPIVAEGVLAPANHVEEMVRAWDGDWRLVRGASLYGPGTGSDDAWFEQFRAGALLEPGDGTAWFSPIHIADLAAAFVTVLEKAGPRSAWIAADDHPMTYSDLFATVARLSGGDPASVGAGAEARLPSFRVSNAALKELGWAPGYASAASGLVATAEKFAPHK